MSFEQKNATLDKVSTRLTIAGISSYAPILSGLHASITLQLHTGETLKKIRIYATGFEKVFAVTTDYTITAQVVTVANVVFGTDTTVGRNYIEWTTSNGVASQQFFVKAPPTTKGIYVRNQDAQTSAAVTYKDAYSGIAMHDNVTFSINIMPYWTDEFFYQQWYVSNAWANTVRHYGGAKTAEVLLDGVQAVAEQNIEDVYGHYWTSPAYGDHTIVIRLRGSTGSSYYVDLSGTIQVRQLPC